MGPSGRLRAAALNLPAVCAAAGKADNTALGVECKRVLPHRIDKHLAHTAAVAAGQADAGDAVRWVHERDVAACLGAQRDGPAQRRPRDARRRQVAQLWLDIKRGIPCRRGLNAWARKGTARWRKGY